MLKKAVKKVIFLIYKKINFKITKTPGTSGKAGLTSGSGSSSKVSFIVLGHYVSSTHSILPTSRYCCLCTTEYGIGCKYMVEDDGVASKGTSEAL